MTQHSLDFPHFETRIEVVKWDTLKWRGTEEFDGTWDKKNGSIEVIKVINSFSLLNPESQRYEVLLLNMPSVSTDNHIQSSSNNKK